MINISKISDFALDVLFPVSCLSCGKADDWLCEECLEKIPLLSEQVCPYCEKNTTVSGRICPLCKDKIISKNSLVPMDNLIVSASYRENIISRLVRTYKYNFVKDLSSPLGKILIKSILKNNLPLSDLIIPIPLHPRRLRWRGFNQSELLSDYISENLTPGMNIPVYDNFVTRVRYTRPQMKIKNYQERQKNIKNIFSLTSPNPPTQKLLGKTILLVDDIATTGSTLFECAKVLKANGAKKVFGVVLARQEIK